MPVFYRGDTRAPDAIRSAGGFTLWPEAKRHVEGAGGIDSWLYTHLFLKYKNNRDIQRYVITGKSHERPTISTARDEGCGGYDDGYIYRIEFTEEELSTQPFSAGMMSYPTTHDVKMLGGKGLDVLMNAKRMKEASIVAIDLKVNTQEVAFFSDIPLKYVKASKPASGGAFQAM